MPGKCQLLDSQFRLHCTRNMTAICVGLPPLPATATSTFHSTKKDFAKNILPLRKLFSARPPPPFTLHVTFSISFREFAWFDAWQRAISYRRRKRRARKIQRSELHEIYFYNYFNLHIPTRVYKPRWFHRKFTLNYQHFSCSVRRIKRSVLYANTIVRSTVSLRAGIKDTNDLGFIRSIYDFPSKNAF